MFGMVKQTINIVGTFTRMLVEESVATLLKVTGPKKSCPVEILEVISMYREEAKPAECMLSEEQEKLIQLV